MGRNKKTYTDEFKRKCMTELLDGKSFSDVCADNNVAPSTLSDWKKAILESLLQLLHHKSASCIFHC